MLFNSSAAFMAADWSAMILCHYQHSKWKFRRAAILLESETMIYQQENGKNGYTILITAGMKFRNKRSSGMIHQHIPAHFKHWSLLCTMKPSATLYSSA
jgi:hypothetical protein